jgi:rSAM/selenodomain-associated transferase 2
VSPAGGPPLVSVIVPVLDEARALPRLLDHLAALRGDIEVIVVDGGSADASRAIVRAHPLGATLLRAGGGRAGQMNAGAAAAAGEALVFLHADTRLPPTAHSSLAAALARGVEGGNFALRFDGGGAFARLLGSWYAVQRRLGVFYGDSAIFVRADAFRALGGYRPLAIMEDYDLARRLSRRRRTACLPGPAVTSSRRWRRLGVGRTVAAWAAIRWLYLLGVPAERLARLYRPAR